MQKYLYSMEDTCAKQVQFGLEDGRVHDVQFNGGCNGNLKALAVLVEGMTPAEIAAKLSEVTCNGGMSCAAQLAVAVQSVGAK